MKFIAKAILIGLLAYVLTMYLPWWSLAIAAFIGGFAFKTKAINSFLAGALGVGLLWLYMIVAIDINSDSLLTNKMTELLKLDNKNLLIAISVLVGSLVGAMAAWSGDSFRKLFVKKRNKGYYS